MIRRIAPLPVFAAGWLLPAAAAACSVCMSGNEEESRLAFILTTVFLSVLPPGMVGGLVWWLWRRTRAQREREASLALGTARELG